MSRLFKRLDQPPIAAGPRVRGMSAQDVERVADIHLACKKTYPYPPISVYGLRHRTDTILTVVEDRGQVHGFLALQRAGDEWAILLLGVAPAQQRKGYGRRLIEQAKGLIDPYHPHLRVRLPETHLNAVCVFRSLGFKAMYTEWGIGPGGCDMWTFKWPWFD